MEIREVRREEHAALGDLTVAAYRSLGDAHVLSNGYEDELRDVAARAADAPVLVAVDGDRVVGGVTYVPAPGNPWAEKEEEGEAGIRMLAVHPSAAGRGIGRALVEACIDRARADGRRRLVLLTGDAMASAHRLYASLGFRRAPERDWEIEPGFVLRCQLLDLRPEE